MRRFRFVIREHRSFHLLALRGRRIYPIFVLRVNPTMSVTTVVFSVSPLNVHGNPSQASPIFLVSPVRRRAPKTLQALGSSSFSGSVLARDVVIDFGKYKGRMMGTLPSTYLKWVSKNLRARDFQEWADRADQVLADPVYTDRIEWEHAQKILTANELSRVSGTRNHSNSSGHDPVSNLLEISKRFGWDNDDKEGWERVDFEFLGTSKGGRIPRINNRGRLKNGDSRSHGDDGHRRISRSSSEEAGVGERNVRSGIEGRRELRRERQRMRKTEDGGGVSRNQLQVSEISSSSSWAPSPVAERGNPFPGRQAILTKISAVDKPS